MRANERGMTLVELAITLAIAGIVTTGVFSTMLSQQQIYARVLSAGEAQENARAALNFIERLARETGWSYAAAVTLGTPAAGQCFTGALTDTCDAIDAGSDRLRLVAGRATAAFIAGS